jgi:hypothetical protein
VILLLDYAALTIPAAVPALLIHDLALPVTVVSVPTAVAVLLNFQRTPVDRLLLHISLRDASASFELLPVPAVLSLRAWNLLLRLDVLRRLLLTVDVAAFWPRSSPLLLRLGLLLLLRLCLLALLVVVAASILLLVMVLAVIAIVLRDRWRGRRGCEENSDYNITHVRGPSQFPKMLVCLWP